MIANLVKNSRTTCPRNLRGTPCELAAERASNVAFISRSWDMAVRSRASIFSRYRQIGS